MPCAPFTQSIVQIRISLWNGTHQTHASYSTAEQQMKSPDETRASVWVLVAANCITPGLIYSILSSLSLKNDIPHVWDVINQWYERRVVGIGQRKIQKQVYAKLTLILVLLEVQRIIGAAAVNLSVQLMAIRWSILGHGEIQWLLINFIVCTMATI